MEPEQAYRLQVKPVVLTKEGRAPALCTATAGDLNVLRASISRVLRLVDSSASHRAPLLPSPTVPTDAERTRAWKHWILSHHLFLPMLALTGDCLGRAGSAYRASKGDDAFRWLALAGFLRRGCGSLFLWGLDFEPCAPIYCQEIRAQMPPAFSGYQARDRQNGFLPGLAIFRDAVPDPEENELSSRMHAAWVQSDLRYHELHEKCMLRAVPASEHTQVTGRENARAPESLRASYRRHHGCVPELGEEAFAEFDAWFGVERSPDLTWYDYAVQIASVAEQIVLEIRSGNRLSPDVTADLLDSVRAAMVVFGRWIRMAPRFLPAVEETVLAQLVTH